jgi:hypothetical protein
MWAAVEKSEIRKNEIRNKSKNLNPECSKLHCAFFGFEFSALAS